MYEAFELFVKIFFGIVGVIALLAFTVYVNAEVETRESDRWFVGAVLWDIALVSAFITALTLWW